MVKFEILGEIQTKARPRARVVNGKFAQMYNSKETIYYENLVKQVYSYQVGINYGNKPLKATIKAYFKAPASLEKYKKYIDADLLKCDVHKDCDNLAKIILDALNKISYNDDKQIYELNVIKYWTFEQEKVIVELEETLDFETIKLIREKDKLLDKLNANKKLTDKEKQKLEWINSKLYNNNI